VCRVLQRPGDFEADQRSGKPGLFRCGINPTGATYHVASGKVTKIFNGISSPNSICFSPDGTVGYYTDSRINRLMRVMVDPLTGLPSGEPIV
ncbi:SMP-30/gluconolactonase/LRE family protein, partial [Rhizobium leguminosarum]|uniref:SMP-30/gluconolactonase/LRE family protein n=1 Tax=Rhizobium leguminosarum TaxID=384 RepID=UPI003F999F4E